MNPETRYLEAARAHAQGHLRPDFAASVIRGAAERRRNSRNSRLTIVTAAACLAAVVAAHLAIRAETSSVNLATWSQTQQQVLALEENP